MEWWIWEILGVLLLALELLTPGAFFLFFFGIGGIFTGVLVSMGVTDASDIQALLFLIISVLLLLIVRPRIVAKSLTKNPTVDHNSLVGESVLIADNIKTGQMGRGELRGASWSVKNVGDKDLVVGENVLVVKMNGLTLEVKN